MEKKAIMEAAMFISNRPLKLKELSEMSGTSPNEAEQILEEIMRDLHEEHRGVELLQIGDTYELKVKTRHLEKVSHLAPYADINKGMLKVLSLVVYRQPITQSDIVKTIGNKAYEYVQTLEERKLVRTEKFGRTKLINITDEFMSYFGIKDKKQLIEMFRESDKDNKPNDEIIGLDFLEKMN